MVEKTKKSFPVSFISRIRMGTDGEGVRTLILMGGCPLRCAFCINPFTWNETKPLKMMTSEQIYSEICIDELYMLATKGGITFGGGEPLLYPELICDMRELCNPDITVFVETSLHVDWKKIEKSATAIDRYYIDIKTLDRKLYHDYTGKDLRQIEENLKQLVTIKGADDIVVRVPEIPGIVDRQKQLKTKEMLSEMGIIHFDLFKYYTGTSGNKL